MLWHEPDSHRLTPLVSFRFCHSVLPPSPYAYGFVPASFRPTQTDLFCLPAQLECIDSDSAGKAPRSGIRSTLASSFRVIARGPCRVEQPPSLRWASSWPLQGRRLQTLRKDCAQGSSGVVAEMWACGSAQLVERRDFVDHQNGAWWPFPRIMFKLVWKIVKGNI